MRCRPQLMIQSQAAETFALRSCAPAITVRATAATRSRRSPPPASTRAEARLTLALQDPRALVLVLDADVRQQGEQPAGDEGARRLRPADLRLDPVERGRREDRVVRAVADLGILERRLLEADGVRVAEPAPGGLGEVRARLDGVHAQAARDEQLGQLAGAAADLEDRRVAVEAACRDRRVDELLRIARTGRIVGLGDAVEDAAELRKAVGSAMRTA